MPARGQDAASASNGLPELGAYLFQSPLISADATVSCATCHVPALGFSGDRPLAIGVAGYVPGRRAPALLGLRGAGWLMWDGRAAGLATQVAIPLASPEMAVDWDLALSRLRAEPPIGMLVQAAGLPGLDRASVVAALAAYVASLDAGPSRFDRFYYGQDPGALTQQEVWGLRLFVRKAGCAGCHLLDGRAAPFTDGAFHATGVGVRSGVQADRGRALVTGQLDDEGAFKTPGLRGVALRPFLMHDGSLTSLRQAVEHYNRRDMLSGTNLDSRLRPLFLAPDEVEAIVAFLGTLTPDKGSPASEGLREVR